MIKYTSALLFLCIVCTSCGQNKINEPQKTISKANDSKPKVHQNSAGEEAVRLAETSNVPVSMVRHVKQARNGDILIASFLGVFRYDGTSFINLTSKISPPLFSSFWDVLEDQKGNLWFGTRDSGVYYYPAASLSARGKSMPMEDGDFLHFTMKDGLESNYALHF